MLVGYVSNERYLALSDVSFEFRGNDKVVLARSSISGAVYVDIEPGSYEVVFGKQGFGSKIVSVELSESEPYQFRLLADGLLGYMWPKCVQGGEIAEFRVHSDEEFSLELWRYGQTKELVRRIGTYDEHGPRATIQITPDGDYTQTGAMWNKHGYSNKNLKQTIVAPDRSGLYYLHATSKSGKSFNFPWIVAPSIPTCNVAVLASDINWNAYNSFGGRSNYIHASGFPATPTINSRLELKRYVYADHMTYSTEQYAPLSLDRPDPYNHIPNSEELDSPIQGRQGCHLASAEWRFLGWMEREGFEYDYYSETQLHFDVVPLDEYDVLVISVHPEYWSVKMFEQLKKWVHEDGGKLIYLGGNGLDCEAEFIDDHRIIYQNTKWSHTGQNYAESGEPQESRMHRRHESQAGLLGQVFSWPGAMTAAPYEVINPSHWCFSDTGLGRGDLFGTESLHQRVPGGASGHETDKISPFSPGNTELLAKGLNQDDGGAHMVYYNVPSGGEVFSVGSICWNACVVVDDNISTITANVLRRFSGQ